MKKLSDNECLLRDIKIITSNENILNRKCVPNNCSNILKYNLRANHYYRELLRASIIPLVINPKTRHSRKLLRPPHDIRESFYRAIYVT